MSVRVGKQGNGRVQKFRVLVVDDAEGIRSYLANLLEIRGYDVVLTRMFQ